nr:hypothetical protein [Bifidobacterium saguinibicoloris]
MLRQLRHQTIEQQGDTPSGRSGVLRDVITVELEDVAFHLVDPLEITRFDIRLDRLRHTADEHVFPEQAHCLAMKRIRQRSSRTLDKHGGTTLRPSLPFQQPLICLTFQHNDLPSLQNQGFSRKQRL